MIHEGITFHNVEEMCRQEDGGFLLQRLPEGIRAMLELSANMVERSSD